MGCVLGGKRGRITHPKERIKAINLIEEAKNAGARIRPACNVIGISIRTYERWVQGGKIHFDKRTIAKRPAPKNKLSHLEYKNILKIVNSNEFVDLPPSQIVPILADRGIYLASESTIYRILRKEKMLKHRGKSKVPKKSKTPTTHIATAANQVWTWDITFLKSNIRGKYYKLYMAIDLFSRKIIGWEVWEEESGKHAADLIEKAVVSEKILNKPLILHSDNGSPMKASTLLAKLEMLGIQPSYSRPRVSNDNPYSESLFRTCKYRPNFPYDGFNSLQEAREWVMQFVNWYNNNHRHSGLKFLTPIQRHNGQTEEIMKKRRSVYESAKTLYPERWSKTTRNWNLPNVVALNPTDEIKISLRNVI